MLKKQNRLTTNFEFSITKKYGQRYNFGLFNAVVLKPQNYTGPTKIGFVIPNTIHKKASKRNRVKRMLREAIRLGFDKLPPNLWITIYINQSILDRNYEEISLNANKFIQKISGSN